MWKVKAKWQKHVTSSKFNLHSSFNKLIIVQRSKDTTRCFIWGVINLASGWHFVCEIFSVHNLVSNDHINSASSDCTILTTPCLGRVVTPSYPKSITMRGYFRLLSLRLACLLLNKVERFVWKEETWRLWLDCCWSCWESLMVRCRTLTFLMKAALFCSHSNAICINDCLSYKANAESESQSQWHHAVTPELWFLWHVKVLLRCFFLLYICSFLYWTTFECLLRFWFDKFFAVVRLNEF